MNIPRPTHESFNMEYNESIAFWLMIIREYSHKEVRAGSLLLWNNKPLVRSDENEG